MANLLTNTSELTSIANAIRSKTGKTSSINFPNGFVSEIGSISGGGGSSDWEDVHGLFTINSSCTYDSFLAIKRDNLYILVISGAYINSIDIDTTLISASLTINVLNDTPLLLYEVNDGVITSVDFSMCLDNSWPGFTTAYENSVIMTTSFYID